MPPLLLLPQNWSEVMFFAADVTGVDEQPRFNAWIYGAGIFFCVFMVVW